MSFTERFARSGPPTEADGWTVKPYQVVATSEPVAPAIVSAAWELLPSSLTHPAPQPAGPDLDGYLADVPAEGLVGAG